MTDLEGEYLVFLAIFNLFYSILRVIIFFFTKELFFSVFYNHLMVISSLKGPVFKIAWCDHLDQSTSCYTLLTQSSHESASMVAALFVKWNLTWQCFFFCLYFFYDCNQFDFVKLLDGKALPKSLTDPVSNAKAPKGLLLNNLQETGFIEYMDPGTWHLALYNDGRNLEQVLLHSTPIGEDSIRQLIFPHLHSVKFCRLLLCVSQVFFTLLSFLFSHLLHETKNRDADKIAFNKSDICREPLLF